MRKDHKQANSRYQKNSSHMLEFRQTDLVVSICETDKI